MALAMKEMADPDLFGLPRNAQFGQATEKLPPSNPSNPVVRITVETDGRRLTFRGRDSWALYELMLAGNRGLTTLDRPAPRWSQYILKLRRGGLSVDTIDERHGGAYSGFHGRYVLKSQVRAIEIIRQQDRKAAA